MGPLYLDTSALVKLVVEEPESAALRSLMGSAARYVSSELTVVELLRAVSRRDPDGGLGLAVRARDVLQTISLYAITRSLLMQAAQIAPPELRSLDAVHLATALRLRGQIAAVVSYDHRLATAAEAHGLEMLAPTQEPEPEPPPSSADV